MKILKKLLKGVLIFFVLLIGVVVVFSDDNKNTSKAPMKDLPVVSKEEAIQKLFADLSSEKDSPVGDFPMDKMQDEFLDRVRDADGDYKKEGGFIIRDDKTNELKTFNSLVYLGSSAGGLKLYTVANPKSVKVSPDGSNISFPVFCPELNQRMHWNFTDVPDLENFTHGGVLSVYIDGGSISDEGEVISFDVKQGDKVYDIILTSIWVTEKGDGAVQARNKFREEMKDLQKELKEEFR